MAAYSAEQRLRLSHFCWLKQAPGLCRQDGSMMYSRRHLCYQSQWIVLSWMRINKIPGYWMQRLTWWRIQRQQRSRKYGYIITPRISQNRKQIPVQKLPWKSPERGDSHGSPTNEDVRRPFHRDDKRRPSVSKESFKAQSQGCLLADKRQDGVELAIADAHHLEQESGELTVQDRLLEPSNRASKRQRFRPPLNTLDEHPGCKIIAEHCGLMNGHADVIDVANYAK
ncbi:hypothetical protein HNY73_000691 [Argiope bruennichi]|uniref:Uncharacterized protein n=1 Tax=Argiope bruennichi TaxID=94029 RepID=A0A8T0G4Y3_ARGBR|nr:hypothetical protein HNY73_000691 [Argiope bruennichi]